QLGMGAPIFSNRVYTVWTLLPSWRALLLNDFATWETQFSGRRLFILARADCHVHLHGGLNRALLPGESVELLASGDKFPLQVLKLSQPSFDVEVPLTRGINPMQLNVRSAGGMPVGASTGRNYVRESSELSITANTRVSP